MKLNIYKLTYLLFFLSLSGCQRGCDSREFNHRMECAGDGFIVFSLSILLDLIELAGVLTFLLAGVKAPKGSALPVVGSILLFLPLCAQFFNITQAIRLAQECDGSGGLMFMVAIPNLIFIVLYFVGVNQRSNYLQTLK